MFFLALHLMELISGQNIILILIIQRRLRSTLVYSTTAPMSAMLIDDFTGTRLDWHSVTRRVRTYAGAMT